MVTTLVIDIYKFEIYYLKQKSNKIRIEQLYHFTYNPNIAVYISYFITNTI